MTEAVTMNPVALSRNSKSRGAGASHELRREVHNMLRDVAFVLAQTRLVREEIVKEQQASKKIQGSPEQIAAGT